MKNPSPASVIRPAKLAPTPIPALPPVLREEGVGVGVAVLTVLEVLEARILEMLDEDDVAVKNVVAAVVAVL